MSEPLRCALCGAPVTHLPHGWAAGDLEVFCDDHQNVRGRLPYFVANEALDDAEAMHAYPVNALMRWPFRDVDRLAGALVPGRVYYIAAYPGNGKTSFLGHCNAAWIAQGFKVSYVPLESNPSETMTRVACARVGIDPDYALRMDLHRDAADGIPEAIDLRTRLTWAYHDLRKDRKFMDLFRIDPTSILTARRFGQILDGVRELESDILILDHVDHAEAEDGDRANGIQTANKIQQMALQAAKAGNIPVVLATQLNSSRSGGDKLAHYRPPVMDWLTNKEKKEQIAAVCLGLYRPMDEQTDQGLVQAVRAGSEEPWKIAKPNRIGVVAMKLRYGGKYKGRTVELDFRDGKISDLGTDWAL